MAFSDFPFAEFIPRNLGRLYLAVNENEFKAITLGTLILSNPSFCEVEEKETVELILNNFRSGAFEVHFIEDLGLSFIIMGGDTSLDKLNIYMMSEIHDSILSDLLSSL